MSYSFKLKTAANEIGKKRCHRCLGCRLLAVSFRPKFGHGVQYFLADSRWLTANSLHFELLTFSGPHISMVAESIDNVIRENFLTCYACAIMPDHIHLLIRKHRLPAEEMIEQFQDVSREAIRSSPQFSHGLEHSVWGGPGWKVFLETQEDIRRVIRYIELNPVKIGRPVQRRPFVKVYDGWLPGQVKYSKPRNRKRGDNP